MCNSICLDVPRYCMQLTPGCRVKLHRFDSTTWVVNYGWYSWGGNREVCGWYLTNLCNPEDVKPLQKPDLDDIYLIENV